MKNIYTMDAETRGLYRKAHSIESQDAQQNNLSWKLHNRLIDYN